MKNAYARINTITFADDRAELTLIAEALEKVDTAKLETARRIYDFMEKGDDHAKRLDDTCKTALKFCMKYFDLARPTVIAYQTIGRFVNDNYDFITPVNILTSWKFNVLKELARCKHGTDIDVIISANGITPAWTVRDVRKAVDAYLSDDTDDTDDTGADDTDTGADDTGDDTDTDDTGADDTALVIINGFQAMVGVLGEDNETLKTLAGELIEKGYAIA